MLLNAYGIRRKQVPKTIITETETVLNYTKTVLMTNHGK